jgi:uncharacterized membrane protein
MAEYRGKTLAQIKAARKPLHNVHTEHAKSLRPLERLAVWITTRVGTMGFFLIILTWTVCWLGWNALAPKKLEFDPPMAFVLWLFISNMIQILLMPLIMVGQNVQGGYAEARAEHDLEVNIKAEREIEAVLEHLEYQQRLLIEMEEKLGTKIDRALGAPESPSATAPGN